METLRAQNVSDLIDKLLKRYKISQKPPSSIDEAHMLLTQKTKQCRRYQQKVKQLQFQNIYLRQQNEILTIKAQSNQNDSEQLVQLQNRISIFQNAFNEQRDYVGQLKEMLSIKQQKVKKMIEDYERQIQELKSQKERYQNGSDQEIRNQIMDLRSQLQVQENMISGLLKNNSKLKEENKSIRQKQ